MPTNYPGAIDSLTNPTTTSQMNSPSHAGQHSNANDAVEAIQTELGTDPSGSYATVKARLDAQVGVGTAFPVSPAVGDSFFRTDHNERFTYMTLGGTGRWASDTRERHMVLKTLPPYSTGANNTGAGWFEDNVWVEDLYWQYHVNGTNDGSNHWTLTFYKMSSSGTGTVIVAPTTNGSAQAYATKVTAVDDLVAKASFPIMYVSLTGTGAPAAIDYMDVSYTYRLIAT